MIKVNDPALYAASLATLRRFTQGRSYFGRLVQIFLACKHYGNLIPRVGARTGTNIGTVQRLLDELYDKPSRRPNASIMILFSNNHLFPTAVTGPDITTPSNIWRNNFNIQKGFGCYGRPIEISDPAFRTQSRTLCPHLRTVAPNQLRGASCALEPNALYRREDHPKVFRIDPATRELFIYDPADFTHYAPLVLPPSGKKSPLLPL